MFAKHILGKHDDMIRQQLDSLPQGHAVISPRAIPSVHVYGVWIGVLSFSKNTDYVKAMKCIR
jgi:hypothetical protein